MQKTEATFIARATAFNRHTVGKFFDQLDDLHDGQKFQMHHIYNLDETVAKLRNNGGTQPTMLRRTHAGPARDAHAGPLPIWPRALQWPRMGLPHEFRVVKIIYATCSFF